MRLDVGITMQGFPRGSPKQPEKFVAFPRLMRVICWIVGAGWRIGTDSCRSNLVKGADTVKAVDVQVEFGTKSAGARFQLV